MKIGNFNADEKVLITAEIGNNHEGSFTLAEEMINLAAEAGADAVKFQTIVPERLVSPKQTERIARLKQFQLTYREFEKLADVASSKNVLFLSTPFDIDSARFLNDLVPAYKIASGDNNFFPLIEVIAKTGKPIIMSTGLMEMEEIKQTADFIHNIWNENNINQDMALLHCVSAYPTPTEQANLLAIRKLKKIVPTVGYSDHTLGIQAAICSVALGARIVEKHFTLDKNYSNFHDHKISADPDDMGRLVENIREVCLMLGSGEKTPQKNELELCGTIRRSAAASRDLPKGTIVSDTDLIWIRPGNGITLGNEDQILGKPLCRSIAKGELISRTNVVS